MGRQSEQSSPRWARLILTPACALGVISGVLTTSSAPAAGAHEETPAGKTAMVRILPAPGGTFPRGETPSVKLPEHRDCRSGLPRSRRDRPDIRKGRLVHVIYLMPSDGPDDRLDTKGILDCSIKAQNQWLSEQSDGLRWRFDTFKTTVRDPKTGKRATFEAADVTFVRSARPGSELASAFDVADELENLGFADPNKRYLSYVAAEAGPCGDAIYTVFPQDGTSDGQYAQVYLLSDPRCGAQDFGPPGAPSFSETIAQQELIHNDSVVPIGAPHSLTCPGPTGLGHVCTPLAFGSGLDPERFDIMFPFVGLPLSEKVLDIDNDDYFGHPYPHLLDLKESPYLESVRRP